MKHTLGLREVDEGGDEGAAAFVDRLRALDQPAWAELYDLHHAQLWRYAYARTGNREAAEDLAAQVFTEALSSIHSYRYKGRPVLAWLYRIARNLTAKHVRRHRLESPAGDVEPSGGSLEDGLDAMMLSDALRQLTDEQRDVVVLRFYAGYSTHEIALAMDKRESAIYSLQVRAVGALRRQLDEGTRNSPPKADEKSPLPGIDAVR